MTRLLPALSLSTLLALVLLACDKDASVEPQDDTQTDSVADTAPTDDTGPVDDTGEVLAERELLVTALVEGRVKVPGLVVWPQDRPEAAVETDAWGDALLTLREDETTLCLGFIDDTGEWVCEDTTLDALAVDVVLDAELPGLSVGRILDEGGASVVHRGLLHQDVSLSHSGQGSSIAGIGGWFVVQDAGTVTATIKGTALSVSGDADKGELSLSWPNTSPKVTGPPVIYNGTAYFRSGETLEVDASGTFSDPDHDPLSVSTEWSAPAMGVVIAQDGRGGVAFAPIRLRDSDTLHVYGEADAGTEISLCDGSALTVDESGAYEADLKIPTDARCVVSFDNGGRRWTHVLVAHGNSLRLDGPDGSWDSSTTFSGEKGGELKSADGTVKLTIPGGSVVYPDTGRTVTGEVTLMLTQPDPLEGVPGEPIAERKGVPVGLDTFGLISWSLQDAKGTELAIGGKAQLEVQVSESDAKGAELALVQLDEQSGTWEALGASVSGSTVSFSGSLSPASLAVAEVFEDFGCVRVYVAPGSVKGTPIVAREVNRALYPVNMVGPVGVLTMTELTKAVDIVLYDGHGYEVDRARVPVGLTSLSAWPQTAPHGGCTDITLPQAPPPGSFLSRRLVGDQTIPGGHTPGDVAEAYYKAIDPNDEMTTFQDWVDSLQWPDKLDGSGNFDPRRSGGDDAFAIYGNDGDLGFGREMHLRVWEDWDPGQTGEAPIVAMYTTNYASVGDAAAQSGVIATVAMDYRPNPGSGGGYYTRFYAFDAAGNRIGELPLDDFGVKAMPDLCTNCHGGTPAMESQLTLDATGALVYPSEGRMSGWAGDPTWLPFPVESFGYHPSYTRAGQEAAFKVLNESLLDTNVGPATQELIAGWYAGGASVQDEHFVPADWQAHPTNSSVDAQALYQDVVQPHCRTCHLAMPSHVDMHSVAEFTGYGTYLDTLVCDAPTQMPHAQVTQANFYADIDAKLTFAQEMGDATGSSWGACPN